MAREAQVERLLHRIFHSKRLSRLRQRRFDTAAHAADPRRYSRASLCRLGLAWLAKCRSDAAAAVGARLKLTHQRVRSWCKTLCSAWSALKPDGPGSGAPPWLFAGTSCERRSDAAIYRCALIAPFCPDGYCAALCCAALRCASSPRDQRAHRRSLGEATLWID